MKFKIGKLLIIMLLVSTSCVSQRVVTSNTEPISPETFYSYNMYGDLGSCTVYKDSIVFKSPLDSNSTKSITTAYKEKQLDEQYFIVRNDRKKPSFALTRITKTDEGFLKMAPVLSDTSINALENSHKANKIPNWSSLLERIWYNKDKIDKMKDAPGLNELKRGDIITAMQWRKPLSEKLKQYLEDTQGKRKFMIYRFVENYRNQELVKLGYNPYKKVTYNLQKQFKDDEEVLNLLFEDINF